MYFVLSFKVKSLALQLDHAILLDVLTSLPKKTCNRTSFCIVCIVISGKQCNMKHFIIVLFIDYIITPIINWFENDVTEVVMYM